MTSALKQRSGGLVLVVAGGLGLATELALTEHWHDWWQYIPFALCGLLSASAVGCLRWPGATATRIARIVSAVTVVGACVGIGQHLWANGTFTAEIRPTFTLSQLIVPTLMGASPALAPGVLGLFAAWLWLLAPPSRER